GPCNMASRLVWNEAATPASLAARRRRPCRTGPRRRGAGPSCGWSEPEMAVSAGEAPSDVRRHTGAVKPEPLDDALNIFAGTAPEFGEFGLSNHGPMAAEVLDQLGRRDAIAAWVAVYRVRLDPAPPPPESRLSEAEWPAALGVAERFPEWLALFEAELADRPIGAVVGEWVPRLVPGAVGAAGHGLIRTAHALRAFGRSETHPRRVEVAVGLAYWASRYQELPGPPLLIGHQDVPDALADL